MKSKILLTSIITLACAIHLHAGTHVWSGALDGNWANAANWSSGGAPSAAEAPPVIIQFPSSGAVRKDSTNNLYNLKLDVIAFFGGNYTLYSTIPMTTLNGGQPPFPYAANIVSGGSTNNFIDTSVHLTLATNISVMVASGAELAIGGQLTGPGGYTKTGSGTLSLWGEMFGYNPPPVNNDYAGTTTILDGTLHLRRTVGCGWTQNCGLIGVPGKLVVGDLQATHSPVVLVDYVYQIDPNADIEIYAGATVQLQYDLTARSLTLTGGHLEFLPDYYWHYPQFECETNITSYSHHLASSAILGPGDIRFNGPTTNTPVFFNVVSGSLLCEAGVNGSLPMFKVGDGELVLNGTGYYSGPWTVLTGLLAVGADGFSPGGLTVSNGAQLSIRGPTIMFMGYDTALNLNGFGIGGTNGALVVEHDGAEIDSFIHLDSDTAIVVTNAADTVSAGLTFVGPYKPLITGPGILTKEGPGAFKFTGNQTNGMTTPFLVNQGTLLLAATQGVAAVTSPLVIGNNLNDGTTATVRLLNHDQIHTAAPITINGSGTLDLNGYYQTAGPITLQNGAIKTFGGRLLLSADILATNGTGSIISGFVHLGGLKRAFHLAPGYGVNMQAHMEDSGPGVGFDLDGGGTLTLSGSNSFSGPINVKAGVLYARNDYALGNITNGTLIASGARLAIDGRNLGAEPLTLNGDGGDGYGAVSCSKTNTFTGPVSIGTSGATVNVGGANGLLTFGGAVSGAGGLAKIGDGTLVFSGNQANAYQGLTTVLEGTLELNKTGVIAVPRDLAVGDDVSPAASHFVRFHSGNQVSPTSRVTLHSSGVLDFINAGGGAQTFDSLSGNGAVYLTFSPLTIGGDNSDTTFAGIFTGFGGSSLTKQGAGKLTLNSGSPTWTGSTIINGGTLSLNGSQPLSPVTINAGGTLAGNGVAGPIVANAGKITPGNSVGLLNSGNVNLAASSQFEAEINGTNAGASYDQVKVTGTVNLGNAVLSTKLGFTGAVSNQFVLIANDGIDPVGGTFNGLPEGAIFVCNAAQFQISYIGGDGNDVVLTQLSLPAAPSINITLTNGQIQLTGVGVAGGKYTVKATDDLANPNGWQAIGVATADGNGVLQFSDPDAANHSQRFYRFEVP